MNTQARRWRLGSLVVLGGLVACGSGDAVSGARTVARVYWSELIGPCATSTSVLRRLDLNAASPIDAFTRPGPDFIDRFAVDEAGGKVYFSYGGSSANDTDLLQRANLDGTKLETLATYPKSAGLYPGPVAVDVAAGHLFWIATPGCFPCGGAGCPCPRIQRSNLDGTNPTTIWTLSGNAYPYALALDPGSHLLYWADYESAPDISSIADVGTNARALYTRPVGEQGGVQAVAVDEVHGKLYWLENPQSVGTPAAIRRSNLDGSGVESLLNAGGTAGTFPRGIGVDPVDGKIYWSESGFCENPPVGRILRANLDGSSIEVVRSGLAEVWSLAVVRAASP